MGISDGAKVFQTIKQEDSIALVSHDYDIAPIILNNDETKQVYEQLEKYTKGPLIRFLGQVTDKNISHQYIAFTSMFANRPQSHAPIFYLQKEIGMTILYIPNVGKYILFNDAYEYFSNLFKKVQSSQ